jgi:hypothetical protein
MAYREHEIGTLIRTDPKTAFKKLKHLLGSRKINGNVALLAEAQGVNYRTASRWVERLEAAGYSLRDTIESARNDAKSRGERLYRKLRT